jgi:hypothetical protein
VVGIEGKGPESEAAIRHGARLLSAFRKISGLFEVRFKTSSIVQAILQAAFA